MSSSIIPFVQFLFDDDDDDLEILILILAMKELEDMESSDEFSMSEEEQPSCMHSGCSTETKEKPCTSTDSLAADLVDTGTSTHAHGNEPTVDDNDFQKKLIAAEEPLHSRTEVSRLLFVKQTMELKAQHNMSDESVDALLALFCDVSPEGHKVPANVHECQKLLSDLKIPSFKTQGESSKRKRSRKPRK